jgi:hypothetical protein
VGEPEAVRALLACGGDPLAVCKQRFTALHWLCGETVHQVGGGGQFPRTCSS